MKCKRIKEIGECFVQAAALRMTCTFHEFEPRNKKAPARPLRVQSFMGFLLQSPFRLPKADRLRRPIARHGTRSPGEAASPGLRGSGVAVPFSALLCLQGSRANWSQQASGGSSRTSVFNVQVWWLYQLRSTRQLTKLASGGRKHWQATCPKCGDQGRSAHIAERRMHAVCHLQASALAIWVGSVAQAWVACSHQASFTLWLDLETPGLWRLQWNRRKEGFTYKPKLGARSDHIRA